MNPLESRVIDLQVDRMEDDLDGLIPSDWPISGDEIARYRAGVE